MDTSPTFEKQPISFQTPPSRLFLEYWSQDRAISQTLIPQDLHCTPLLFSAPTCGIALRWSLRVSRPLDSNTRNPFHPLYSHPALRNTTCSLHYQLPTRCVTLHCGVKAFVQGSSWTLGPLHEDRSMETKGGEGYSATRSY